MFDPNKRTDPFYALSESLFDHWVLHYRSLGDELRSPNFKCVVIGLVLLSSISLAGATDSSKDSPQKFGKLFGCDHFPLWGCKTENHHRVGKFPPKTFSTQPKRDSCCHYTFVFFIRIRTVRSSTSWECESTVLGGFRRHGDNINLFSRLEIPWAPPFLVRCVCSSHNWSIPVIHIRGTTTLQPDTSPEYLTTCILDEKSKRRFQSLVTWWENWSTFFRGMNRTLGSGETRHIEKDCTRVGNQHGWKCFDKIPCVGSMNVVPWLWLMKECVDVETTAEERELFHNLEISVCCNGTNDTTTWSE